LSGPMAFLVFMLSSCPSTDSNDIIN
jgi:hypothetical protein